MTAVVLLAGTWSVASAASCPKLLMFDGVDFKRQANVEQARYWGRTVGVQGFFVNNLMAYWQADVGTNPDSKLWRQASRFQSIYSKYGVTDNFIKVALYKGHDWHSPRRNEAAVEHFAHAAALARHAGFKGIALDLEPYKPTWVGSAEEPGLAATIEREGLKIGLSMHAAYPDMTLIVLPDVLNHMDRYKTYEEKLKSGLRRLASGQPGRPEHNRYELAVPFLRGLLAVPWKHVVIAMEQTYSLYDEGITRSIPRVHQHYVDFMQGNGVIGTDFSMAPGLWPLGRTSRDKSARESPERFKQRLEAAFGTAKRYVWIYGKGSAWQTDGPYGAGPVTADFDQYLDAVHQVRTSCRTISAKRHGDSSAGGAGRN